MGRNDVGITWGRLPGESSCRVQGARRIKKELPIPKGWVVVNQGKVYNYIKYASELHGAGGGTKQLWLRLHSEEVLEFYNKHGATATKSRFLLKTETLAVILGGGHSKPFCHPFTPKDKLELRVEILNEDVRCLRQEVREAKEAFALFQQGVASQLTDKFLIPLLQAGIKPDKRLELKPKPDPLSLKDFPFPEGSGD